MAWRWRTMPSGAIRPAASIGLPPALSPEERATLLSALYTELAAGSSTDFAMAVARRAVARAHTATELDWALPVLITRGEPEQVVLPPRTVAGAVGRRAKDETVGWVKSTLSGAVSSVVLFLVGLTLFRLGMSGSPSLSFSIVSPFALYASFKALVLELSTFREYFLLGAAFAFLLLTAASFLLWRRRQRLAHVAAGHDRLFFDILTPVSGLRSVSFFGMATLTLLGAFVYQQYLWNVLLPIDDDALGIAITRDAAAATFSAELADSLFAGGQTRDVVIRELPVKFDARDTDKARSLGKRIGAEAVVIYRSEESPETGRDEYVAYVVFTDPTVGFSVASAGNPVGTGPDAGSRSGAVVDVRDGVAIPVLRTEQMTELVDAAAGIIAYQESNFRDAITHLRRVPLDDDPNTGIVAYYLARALALDGQVEQATPLLDRSIAFYEERSAAPGGLGPQDMLILVEVYMQRGRAERFDNNWDGALTWFHKGVSLREALLARADDLEHPADVPAVFARLYAELADVYRIKGDSEQHRFWSVRAGQEADAIRAAAASDEDTAALNQEATARFVAGDCVNALAVAELAIKADPKGIDPYIAASTIAMFQGRDDLAVSYIEQLFIERPEEPRAYQQLTYYYWLRVIAKDGYFEPAYLDDAESFYREILATDPTNPVALRLLANASEWRADSEMTDLSALLSGDTLSYAKSQELWRNDPERFAAALSATASAIDQRRTIATELAPGVVNDELALAQAYFNRQRLVYGSLVGRYGLPMDDAMQADGAQLLADAQQIRTWTARAIAGGEGVTRLQQLQGWSLFLKSIDREWGWYAFFLQDSATATTLQAEYEAAFASAKALADSEPLTTPDELAVGAQIYITGAFVAYAFENDDAKYQEYQNIARNYSAKELEERAASVATVDTICGEERERLAGNAAEEDNDLAGAAAHYEAALALNPTHLPSLIDAAALAGRQGNYAQAATYAQRAADIVPQRTEPWSRLALATMALGDTDRSDAAWSQLLALSSDQPPQERMHTLQDVVSGLRALLREQPALAPAIAARLTLLADAAEQLEPVAGTTYQLPALYANIAQVALWADEPALAEPWLDQALTLDPHQPLAHTWRAIAALVQGHSATTEIEAAIADTRDPLWDTSSSVNANLLLGMMTSEVNQYVDRFPERAGLVTPLQDAIAAEQAAIAAAGSS
ncbi:MAG: hypothetical protein DCC58_04325 [Chloroflexi bacterium]|nr:MAG: hypothetical protein DCC58_04325 [Chloroflexota bacterium]